MKKKNPYQGIRRTARVLGTIILVFVIFLVLQEYREEFKNSTPSQGHAISALLTLIDGMVYEWLLCGMAMAGLFLAYWREAVGGAIAQVCFIWLALRLSSGHFNLYVLAFLLIVSIPCILYMIYGWKTFHHVGKSDE